MTPPKDDDFEFEGFLAPSYTQVPDEAFDMLMARLSPAEFKVMMYIVRRTFGFKKGADAISLSQIVSGIKTKDGRQLDMGTGLTRRGVTKALAELARRKVILVERRQSSKKGFEATVYRLNIIGNLGHFPHPDDPRMQPLPLRDGDPRELSSLAPRELSSLAPRELSSLEQETVVQDTEQQQPARPRRVRSARRNLVPNPDEVVVVAPLEIPTTGTSNDVVSRLAALGVAPPTIKSMLRTREPALISRWVSYAEHKLANGWVPHESPAAWIVTAIRSGDWVIPDWFRLPEEIEAAKANEAQVTAQEREQLEQDAEQERQAAEEQRRATERQLRIDEQTRTTWDRAKQLLHERNEMTPALFSAFLLPLNGTAATIVTPVEFFCGVIKRHAKPVQRALEEVTGRPMEAIEIKHVSLDPSDPVA